MRTAGPRPPRGDPGEGRPGRARVRWHVGNRRNASNLPGPLIFVVAAVAYLGLAQLVMWLNDPAYAGAGLWPSAGVTTAALLLVPSRRWGWVIAAVVVAELGGDLARGLPLAASLWWTVGNVIGPLVGATLVRRYAHPRGQLVSMRSLIGFITLGAVVGSIAGASVRSVGSVMLDHPVWQVWPRYVLGDALGVLVIAPALLAWRATHPSRHHLESVSLAVLLLVLPVMVFRNWDGDWDTILPYLVTPLLTWAALRYGLRGAAWSVVWVALVANWATASGSGPFAIAGAPPGQAVTLLQLFLGLASVTTLILAVLVDDLSDRDRVERSLRHQAHHDELTGLPNRAVLSLQLEEALKRQVGRDGGVALLVCDLDDFKVINDGLGHEAGDQVLIEAAGRIRNTVRAGDLVVRFGGDEFVVLLEDTDRHVIRTLTERLLAVVTEPFVLDTGQQVEVGLSIGVASSTSVHDAQALLRDADATLFRAKARGKGRVEHFDDGVRIDVLERLALPGELRTGLTRDSELFCLHQPEVDIAEGTLFAFESLVRWQHPQRGLLMPDRFVPLAEAAGLAGPLFTKVLDDTLRTQRAWAMRLGFLPSVSVNLSPRQLNDPELPGMVAMALTRAEMPADLLWLEVTEGAIADASSFSTLTELHHLGVHLGIDDFGTGWSSLSRLSEFPWDLLKIDRSFISRLGADQQAEHVVRATIVMAHALGIRTVAEGVETLQQFEILASMRCDIAQGYLFARPLGAIQAIADVAPDGAWTGPGPLLRQPSLP